MSESATSPRPLGAEEFDRRMRSLAQGQAPAVAPPLGETLAELARLVGEQDPFRNVQPPADGAPHGEAGHEDYAALDAGFGHGVDAGEEPGAPDSPAVVHPPVGGATRWDRPEPRFPMISLRESRPIEPSPDAWVNGGANEGEADDEGEAAAAGALHDDATAGQGNVRRTLIVLAAVVVLTGGGLAASFLARPSGAVVAEAATAPTIMADTGPSKVKPETPAVGPDAPSEPSTLLDKNNNDGTAAAKVVHTVEEPVDLGQAIKPAAPPPAPTAASDAPAEPPSSVFPEPHKVKTVLVRPDGSIIAGAPASPAAADAAPPSAASQQASLAFDPKTTMPIPSADTPPAAPAANPPPPASVPTAAAKPAAPAAKSTVRVVPKAAASTPQGGAPTARTPAATPKPKPKVARAPVKPKPKPDVVADATPTATTPDGAPPVEAPAAAAAPSAGGKFAVQLGAAPSEAEARQSAAQLGQKYAGDLGAVRPAVHKAAAGGKTVYRIRVGNLSQDEAKALCGRIQAGGGGCFVAHN